MSISIWGEDEIRQNVGWLVAKMNLDAISQFNGNTAMQGGGGSVCQAC